MIDVRKDTKKCRLPKIFQVILIGGKIDLVITLFYFNNSYLNISSPNLSSRFLPNLFEFNKCIAYIFLHVS